MNKTLNKIRNAALILIISMLCINAEGSICTTDSCTDLNLDETFENLALEIPSLEYLTAMAAVDRINLSWDNEDGSEILIIRSETDYSTSSNSDGYAIYQGFDSSYSDINIVSGTTYYYSAFRLTTLNDLTRTSSPAFAEATAN